MKLKNDNYICFIGDNLLYGKELYWKGEKIRSSLWSMYNMLPFCRKEKWVYTCRKMNEKQIAMGSWETKLGKQEIHEE